MLVKWYSYHQPRREPGRVFYIKKIRNFKTKYSIDHTLFINYHNLLKAFFKSWPYQTIAINKTFKFLRQLLIYKPITMITVNSSPLISKHTHNVESIWLEHILVFISLTNCSKNVIRGGFYIMNPVLEHVRTCKVFYILLVYLNPCLSWFLSISTTCRTGIHNKDPVDEFHSFEATVFLCLTYIIIPAHRTRVLYKASQKDCVHELIKKRFFTCAWKINVYFFYYRKK